MRITALYIAVIFLAAGLFNRHWGTSSMGADYGTGASGSVIQVGVRDFTEYSSSNSITDPLHELNGMGMPLEHKGLAALIAGIAAALSCAAASQLIRKPRSLVVRGALCVPLAISLVASLVFAHALPKYLDIGWSVYACVASVILGAIAILPRRAAV